MAYRFTPASNPFVRCAIGAFNGYGMRNSPQSAAWLLKRNATGGFQAVHVVDDGTTADYTFPLEFNGSNQMVFDTAVGGWATAATFTNIADFGIYAYSWDGTTTAGALIRRWKIGAGAWQSETGTVTIINGTAAGAGYRHIIGNNGALGDDGSMDYVCGGLIKAVLSQAQIESLSLTSFAAWQAVFTGTGAWLIGCETISALTDRTGNGGDEVSRSAAGITLVSDPDPGFWGAVAASDPAKRPVQVGYHAAHRAALI